ncbi:MFS transporter [Actinomadura sp. WMMA1423]|uniref:MFS transporter n=1 Tax=Actinomadura sp. WMMA1423 TaxID=2591108 RepID=UPI00114626A6|nr:MFS transporter [Actinomadura sp. WMMA1423]
MSETENRAGRREWVGLAVLTLPCLLISMDIGVLFFALPFISAALRPSATQQLWIMDAYGFVLAGMLITMGALGDRIGRRRLLLIGAAAFGAASAGAAYAGSAAMLIAMRGVLGLAGSTLMPSTLALIRNMFHDEKQRKSAVGVWTGAFTGGVVLGPVVGGFLLNHFWWGSAFLINIPAMALLLLLGPLLLPEYRPADPARFDMLGAVLSLAAVLCTIYGIKKLAVDGYSASATAALLVGLALAAAFVRRQLGHENPLIDLRLFSSPVFSSSVLIKIVATFALTGTSLFTNQYLQLVLGMRPLTAALWSLTAFPALMVAMSASVAVSNKVRPGPILLSGLAVIAAGLGVVTQVDADSRLWVVLVGAGGLAAGVMITAPIVADLVLTAASTEQAGAASAVAETSDEFGSALGLAVLGSIGASVYHHRMADIAVPGAPHDAVRSARGTLAAAKAVAEAMPGGAGSGLLRQAREAFTAGMNIAALAGILVVAALAVGVSVLLRRAPAAAPVPRPDAEPARK